VNREYVANALVVEPVNFCDQGSRWYWRNVGTNISLADRVAARPADERPQRSPEDLPAERVYVPSDDRAADSEDSSENTSSASPPPP
jgi:hypothetical protein